MTSKEKELSEIQQKSLFKALTIYGALNGEVETPYDPQDTEPMLATVNKMVEWYCGLDSDDKTKVAIARLAHGFSMIPDEAFSALMFGFTIDIEEGNKDE